MDDPYLTPDEVRARISSGSPPLGPSFGDEWVANAVSEWEELVEHHLGVAFTPRTATVQVRIRCGKYRLKHRAVRSITSVTVDEVAVDDPTAGDIVSDPLGDLLISDYLWTWSTAPAEIVYVHALTDEPPERLKKATALYVERIASLDRSGSNRDVSRQGFDGGSTSFVMPDPANGKLTGFTEIDRLVESLPKFRTAGLG